MNLWVEFELEIWARLLNELNLSFTIFDSLSSWAGSKYIYMCVCVCVCVCLFIWIKLCFVVVIIIIVIKIMFLSLNIL